MSDVVQLLISLLLGTMGGSGVVAIIGRRIVEGQMEKSLENYRFKINSRFDRISKIHEREFDVLPKIWERLLGARTAINEITKLVQQHPDLDRWSPDKIEEFLDASGYMESEKNEIKEARNKTETNKEIQALKKYNVATAAFADFDRVFNVNKVFLTNELVEAITEIRRNLIAALVYIESTLWQSGHDLGPITQAKKCLDSTDQLTETVSSLIQQRLRFDEAY